MDVSGFVKIANGFPEALILLNKDGEILALNNHAGVFLSKHFPQVKQQHSLQHYVLNTEDQLKQILRTWSRSNSPLPSTLKWNSHALKSWTFQGFLFEPATDTESAKMVLRCIPAAHNRNEFTALNKELEKTQASLRKLLETREAFEQQSQLAAVTLSSIADAVITTCVEGKVMSLNPVAEKLTGWSSDECRGKPSASVFNIIDEDSRISCHDPVIHSLQMNKLIALNNHTILISQTGTEYVIEFSVSPIRNKSGEVLGAVVVFHDVTADRLARRQLQYLAQHDMLTGLHNRFYFEQELSRLINIAHRGKTTFALLYIDLDQFKIVNDTAGHGVGDSLLIEVAKLFGARLRSGDILARLGGDEFGILLQNVNTEELHNVVTSYQSTLSSFIYTWGDQQFNVFSSMGVTLIDDHTASKAEVLRQADIACYVAKNNGRNQYHFYNDATDNKMQDIGEFTLLNKINDALLKNQFKLLFQPITYADGSSLDYFEALLRLPDHDQLITPNIFIPVAKRNSMMLKIDMWVMEKVVSMIESNHYPGYTFSVNISGSSINNNEISSFLVTKIKNNNAIADAMIIEITETEAITHIEGAAGFMNELKQYGVKFALDDFGTGFSSFAYLKYLPADLIKIDGIFVRDIDKDPADLAMVRSINHIAHSLGKQTIAEFVENAEIQALLQDMGVDFIQGYHIGKPGELKDTPQPPKTDRSGGFAHLSRPPQDQ